MPNNIITGLIDIDNGTFQPLVDFPGTSTQNPPVFQLDTTQFSVATGFIANIDPLLSGTAWSVNNGSGTTVLSGTNSEGFLQTGLTIAGTISAQGPGGIDGVLSIPTIAVTQGGLSHSIGRGATFIPNDSGNEIPVSITPASNTLSTANVAVGLGVPTGFGQGEFDWSSVQSIKGQQASQISQKYSYVISKINDAQIKLQKKLGIGPFTIATADSTGNLTSISSTTTGKLFNNFTSLLFNTKPPIYPYPFFFIQPDTARVLALSFSNSTCTLKNNNSGDQYTYSLTKSSSTSSTVSAIYTFSYSTPPGLTPIIESFTVTENLSNNSNLLSLSSTGGTVTISFNPVSSTTVASTAAADIKATFISIIGSTSWTVSSSLLDVVNGITGQCLSVCISDIASSTDVQNVVAFSAPMV